MAKTGKTSAGAVPESVPHLKSKGKAARPAVGAVSDLDMGQGQHPDMSKGNDGSGGKGGSAPASKKKDPTD